MAEEILGTLGFPLVLAGKILSYIVWNEIEEWKTEAKPFRLISEETITFDNDRKPIYGGDWKLEKRWKTDLITIENKHFLLEEQHVKEKMSVYKFREVPKSVTFVSPDGRFGLLRVSDEKMASDEKTVSEEKMASDEKTVSEEKMASENKKVDEKPSYRLMKFDQACAEWMSYEVYQSPMHLVVDKRMNRHVPTPSWSPSSRFLLFRTVDDDKLCILDLIESKGHILAHNLDDRAYSVRWNNSETVVCVQFVTGWVMFLTREFGRHANTFAESSAVLLSDAKDVRFLSASNESGLERLLVLKTNVIYEKQSTHTIMMLSLVWKTENEQDKCTVVRDWMYLIPSSYAILLKKLCVSRTENWICFYASQKENSKPLPVYRELAPDFARTTVYLPNSDEKANNEKKKKKSHAIRKRESDSDSDNSDSASDPYKSTLFASSFSICCISADGKTYEEKNIDISYRTAVMNMLIIDHPFRETWIPNVPTHQASDWTMNGPLLVHVDQDDYVLNKHMVTDYLVQVYARSHPEKLLSTARIPKKAHHSEIVVWWNHDYSVLFFAAYAEKRSFQTYHLVAIGR